MSKLVIAATSAFAALLVSTAASAANKDAPSNPSTEDGREEKPTSLSVAATPVLPIGDLSNAVSLGVGATLGIDHAVHRNVSVIGRTGYIHHFPSNGLDITYGALPVWGGARYRFTGADGGYLEGLAGPTVLFASVDLGSFGRRSDSEVRLGMTLGGGYHIGSFDVGGRFVFYDIGHAGDSMGLMASVGWSFASF